MISGKNDQSEEAASAYAMGDKCSLFFFLKRYEWLQWGEEDRGY